MDTNTSRRALIGGAGLAAIVAAAPVLASPSSSATADPQWDRLLATFNHADAKMLALGKEHDVKSSAYQAGRQRLGEKPVAARVAYPRPIDEMTVAELRAFDPVAPKEDQQRYEAARAAWDAEEAALDRRTMGDVDARWEAALDEQFAAANAIIAYPAPTSAALIYKLALVERQYHGCDLDERVKTQCFADVRRLLRAEG